MPNRKDQEVNVSELGAVLGGQKVDAFAGAKAGASGTLGTGEGSKEPRGGMVIVIGVLLLFGI